MRRGRGCSVGARSATTAGSCAGTDTRARDADGDDEMRGSSGTDDSDGSRDGDADGVDAMPMDDRDDTAAAMTTDDGGGRGGGAGTPAATSQDSLASYVDSDELDGDDAAL